jgi:multidrug efflux system membrane fusion protein
MRLSARNVGLAAIAIAFAAAGFLVLNGSTHSAPQATKVVAPAVATPVVPVIQRSVPVWLDVVGTTEAIRSVTLEARITGFLAARLVNDGEDVQKGEMLYQIDPRDYQASLDQATAQARRDAAAVDYSRLSYGRNKTLVASGAVARDTFEQSTSKLQQSEASLAADAAAVQAARLNLQYTEIRAPFAGRLGRSLVHEGTLINATSTQLNTLVQLDPIYVTFNPSETDLGLLSDYRSGKVIAAEVTSADDAGKQYTGTLTFVNNAVDRSTGTILARATIANPDHSLLPGAFVHVRLHVADHPDTLLVPQVALGSSQFGKYVYVAENGKAMQRMVTTGATYGDLVIVTKGVTAREAVVVGNLQKIAPGAPVRPIAANGPGDQDMPQQ